MKKLITLLGIGLLAFAAAAQTTRPVAGDLQIERRVLGSGVPGAAGLETAKPVDGYGVHFAPQNMPGYPTAATIWPRVVEVPCKAGKCEGYQSSPALGRGEYLYIRPAPAVAVAPPVIIPAPPPVIIRETPKPIRQ